MRHPRRGARRAPARRLSAAVATLQRSATAASDTLGVERGGGGCSTRRLRAGTSTSRPGGCRRQGRGFYTIGSAGHESNALVALALRPTDPALLHYRSGGFYCARAAQVRGLDAGPRRAAGPDGAGRRADRRRPAQGVRAPGDLAIIPQTSTIASHLPRAVGLACRAAPGAPARGRRRSGRRTRRGVLLRRRLGQPLHRGRGDQHRAQRRLPRAAGPAAVRLRGQRSGHLGADPGRLDRGARTAPARA